MNGLPQDDYVHVAREDPKRPGLLYAGTEHGLYVSFDDGDLWQSLRLNLPDTQVSDLVIQENELIIATHGRSFWVLDNLAIVRQADPKLTASALHLFEPDTAIRSFRPATITIFRNLPTSGDLDSGCERKVGSHVYFLGR